jgi:lipoprotein-releasing system permease protein
MNSRLPISVWVGWRFSGAASDNQLLSFISRISTAGLVLGVALLVLVVAVMNGFDRELRTTILGVVPQVSLYHREGIQDWTAEIEQLRELDPAGDAIGIAPFVHLEGLLNASGTIKPALIFGIDTTLEKSVSNVDQFIDSDLLVQLDQEVDSLLLGRKLAAKLDVAVGDSITLVVPKPNRGRSSASLKRVQVIGFIATGTELDESMGLMGLQSATEMAPVPGAVTGLRLRYPDLFSAPQKAAQLVNAMPFGYYASDWTRTHGNLYHAVQMSSSLVSLLLVLIIGIAVFNVVSTLVLSVAEKQTNIAILRTLGATPGEVLQVFIVQGLVIGTTGTVLGLLIGLGLTVISPGLVSLIETTLGMNLMNSEIYPVSFLPIDNRVGDVANIGITALVLSVLASVYPAWRASRILPAQALRYD